jgi:hypothetical protein
MTAKKDLKKRVRDRQARTGESYTTALGQVLAQRPEGEGLLVELTDLTAEAQGLGLRCRHAYASPKVVERVEGPVALARLRDALRATTDDPATALMRSVLLDGKRATAQRPSPQVYLELRRFMARIEAGVGGASEHGTMLALHVPARRGHELLVCMLRLMPDHLPGSLAGIAPLLEDRYPALMLATADGLRESKGLVPWL